MAGHSTASCCKIQPDELRQDVAIRDPAYDALVKLAHARACQRFSVLSSQHRCVLTLQIHIPASPLSANAKLLHYQL